MGHGGDDKVAEKNRLNCIAINPQWYDEYFIRFPHGLATICAIVRDLGHDISVIDFDANRVPDNQKKEYLGKYAEPDVVLLTGMISSYARLVELVSTIRQVWKKSYLILCGGLSSTAPDGILLDINADLCVVGEGDDVIRTVLSCFRDFDVLRAIPNLRILHDGKIIKTPPSLEVEVPDISKTPRPFYEIFPMNKYVDHLKDMDHCFEIYTSKGCPCQCTYCYRISGKQVRHRNVDDVIEEMTFIRQNYGFDKFSFIDDCFALNKAWVYEFCDKVRPLGMKFRFQAFMNVLDEPIIDKMQSAGLIGVSLGIESGSGAIQKEYKKNIVLKKADDLVALLQKKGINNNASFIIGAEGEDHGTIEATKDFLIRNRFATNFQLFFLTPYPGSSLYNRALAQGKIKDEIQYIKSLKLQNELTINLTKFPDEQLYKWKEYIIVEVARTSGIELKDTSGVIWIRETSPSN